MAHRQNNRESKRFFQYLESHNVKAGHPKKRRGQQHGRRTLNRFMKERARVYVEPVSLGAPLEPVSGFSRATTRDWAVLTHTMAHAFEKAGISNGRDSMQQRVLYSNHGSTNEQRDVATI